jgi:hypothetical protein
MEDDLDRKMAAPERRVLRGSHADPVLILRRKNAASRMVDAKRPADMAARYALSSPGSSKLKAATRSA